MKDKIKNRLRKWLLPLILVVVVAWLSVANYEPGTWLSGWDTLHPEFDFPLYLKRVISGAWQEHQGVGAVASQAHAAELPRVFLLYLLSLLLPDSAVRYGFFFLTLLAGTLGMYVFSRNILGEVKDKLAGKLSSFVAALFYLLNLATVQQYYVPFEMFAVHFASLPWLFHFAYEYVKGKKKKSLMWYGVISIAATSMAHTATLFYVYLGALVLFLGTLSFLEAGKKWQMVKKGLVVLAVTLAVNAFWLLPNIYYIARHASDVTNSRIHQIFSGEAYLQSRSFGTLSGLATQKNFLFNWRELDVSENEFVDLMDEWVEHYDGFGVRVLAYGLFAIALFGVLKSLKEKRAGYKAMLPILGVAVFFLINANFPLTVIYEVMRDLLPVIGEGLRFPFTKFSFLLTFTLASYIGLAVYNLLKKLREVNLKVGLVSGLVLAMVYTMLPMFTGHLISPSLRVNIPGEYFETFTWFKGQDHSGRIARLPVHTLWGWNFYSWDYQGAGFAWFGLPQPLLDREFDRWSSYNETFYNQLSMTVYSKDVSQMEKVLNKYQVKYLLIDESVINPGGDKGLLYIPEIKEMFGDSNRIKLAYENGFLKVYETDFKTGDKFVLAPDEYVVINANTKYAKVDKIYDEYGTYVSGTSGELRPLANLDNRAGTEIEVDDKKILIRRDYGEPVRVGKLVIPNSVENADKLLVSITAKKAEFSKLQLKFSLESPVFKINGGEELSGQELWQIYEIDYDSELPKFLEISDEIFSLDEVLAQDEEVLLGVVFSDENKEVVVRSYAGERLSYTTAMAGIFSNEPRLCSNPDEKTPLVIEENGFILNFVTEPVCLGNFVTIEQDSLATLSYDAVSADNLAPQFCITKEGTEGCVNKAVADRIEEWGEAKHLEYDMLLTSGGYWMDFVAQGGDAGAGQITYKNFKLENHPLIKESKIPLGDNLTELSEGKEIVINDEVEQIEVVLPAVASVIETMEMPRGNAGGVNCDIKKLGEVFKLYLDEGVDYRAEGGGVSCDFFVYPDLSYDQGYVLNIKGENRNGRSLKAYLYNHTSKRMDLEELMDDDDFDQSVVILPKKIEGSGYTLNLETRSYGRVGAHNLVEEIAFYQLPVEWLAKVRLMPDGVGRNGVLTTGFGGMIEETVKKADVVKTIDNTVRIKNVEKVGTWKYRVDVEARTNDGLLALSQGYEDGWVAYKSLGTNERLEKVKVNGWSNGWVVPKGDYRIEIVYWPQYLQWIGLGILIVGSGTMAIKRRENAR